MAVRTPTAIHLCDGYGGFELAFRHAFTPEHRPVTVARVERDSYAAAILVERMGEKALDEAPIWDDLTTFDGEPWRDRVDWITAGFPCQPFSAAGQHKGLDDERWIWPDIARIIADVRPRYVYLENVTGLIRHGLPHVLTDLAALGFDAEWSCLPASAVGAPHRRERVWILAYTDRDGLETLRRGDHIGRDANRPGGSYVANTDRPRRSTVARSAHGDEGSFRPIDRDEPDSDVQDVADAACVNGVLRGRLSEQQPERWRKRPQANSKGLFPPPPDDLDGWQRWVTAGGPEPQIRRSTDGPPLGLADALHLGGNGLVPQAAAEALRQLARRAGE